MSHPPGFGRAVGTLVGGTAGAQAIVLLASPLLTRLYTPHDFGLLAVFSALLGIVGGIACLRYELAVLLPKDDDEGVNLLVLAVATAAAAGAVVALAVGGAGARIAGWVGAPAIRPYLWLLPIGITTFGLYVALSHWAMRKKAFGRITRTRLGQSLGQVGAQTGFGVFGAGPLGLMVGQVLGQSAGITTLAHGLWREAGHHLRRVRPREMLRLAVAHRRFPLLASGAALLNSASRLLPALLIAGLYGPQVAGWFALAQRVMEAPMRLLGEAVAQAYLSEAPKLARTDNARLEALFMAITRRLLLFGLPCLGVVALTAPGLFAWVFGAQWSETGRLAQFLAVMYLAQFVVSPTSQTFAVFARQDIQLGSDALRLAVLLATFTASFLLAWSPGRAIAVFSVGQAGSYLLVFLLARRLIRTAARPAA